MGRGPRRCMGIEMSTWHGSDIKARYTLNPNHKLLFRPLSIDQKLSFFAAHNFFEAGQSLTQVANRRFEKFRLKDWAELACCLCLGFREKV